ncbi:hypothetical protein GALL_372500 [mine drainage metagenome]|uniref:Uncharacterized protein n=1 Tax=mine drainage metagenome TaxID=410659 RepID=A0A1J5QYK9_9ZZZZ
MSNTPEGYTPEQWEQFKIHFERLRAEYAAAGGFSSWVRKREAARKASDARGYPVNPDAFSIRDARPDDERNGFADMVKEEDSGGPPELWAYWFAFEMAQRNGWDYATQTAAEAQIMRAFEVAADTLPLRQYPSMFRLPQGHPLPPKWREGCFMLKAELREWAKQHAPDLLGSALLAEPQPAPPEQGVTATARGVTQHSTCSKRRHPLEHVIEPIRDKLSDPNDAAALHVALEHAGEPFLGKWGGGGGWVYETPGPDRRTERVFTLKNCRDYLRSRAR